MYTIVSAGVPGNAWSAYKTVSYPVSGNVYATLDGSRGATRARLKTAVGETLLSHGMPVFLEDANYASVSVSSVDTSSQVCILFSKLPIHLGKLSQRSVDKTLSFVSIVGTALPTDGLIVSPTGGVSIARITGDPTQPTTVSAYAVIDTGGTPVLSAALANQAVAAGTSQLLVFSSVIGPILLNPTLTAGAGSCRIRTHEVIF